MTPSMSAAGNGGSSSPSNGSDARKRVPSNNNGNAIDCTPPDFLLPGASSNDRPLLPLHPANKEQNRVACLKILTTSAWNPPPGQRRMHGDLMYVFIVTLEDKRFHITASTRGFYVNQMTEDEFNPRPAPSNYLSHSLIELLNQISPGFKRNFAVLQKRRTGRHPFERVATPYQVYTWQAPLLEHTVDAIRAEDAFSSKLGYEEHIPGQVWLLAQLYSFDFSQSRIGQEIFNKG